MTKLLSALIVAAFATVSFSAVAMDEHKDGMKKDEMMKKDAAH